MKKARFSILPHLKYSYNSGDYDLLEVVLSISRSPSEIHVYSTWNKNIIRIATLPYIWKKIYYN